MLLTHQYKELETYKDCNICLVNYRNVSQYIGIVTNGQLSCIALSTVKAAKNVIDTHENNKLIQRVLCGTIIADYDCFITH